MNEVETSRVELQEQLAELRLSHDMLSRLLQTSPENIILTRLSDGKILEVNDGFCRNSGLSRSDAIGKTTAELDIWVHQEDRDRFVRILEDKGECRNFAALIRSNGRILHSLISDHIVEVDGEQCLVANSRDISDLKEAEEALRRRAAELAAANHKLAARERELEIHNQRLQQEVAERERLESETVRLERLSALGQMAQGVAHNFNNLLAIVLGHAEMLQSQLTDAALRQEVQLLIDGVMRAAELVRRLNQAVRTEQDEMQPVSVETVVRDALEVSRPQWKDEPESKGIPIDIVTDLVETPPIRATESGLHQIFINLLFNALEALPKGGTIRIASKLAPDRVEVTFSDDGIGMSEESRPKSVRALFHHEDDRRLGPGFVQRPRHGRRLGGRM